MSITRNGRKIRNPISKAFLISEIMNAGISAFKGMSDNFFTSFAFESSMNFFISFSRVCFNINALMGSEIRLKASSSLIFSSMRGFIPVSYATSIVGLIMKILRKRAKLTKTTFGGDC